jgi:hypothetical protein
MAEAWEGLPLNTPTKVSETSDYEVWATRTTNGGMTEFRTKTGSALDTLQQREVALKNAIATLRQWSQDAANAPTATNGNILNQFETVKDRLGIFMDRFADLLESIGKA